MARRRRRRTRRRRRRNSFFPLVLRVIAIVLIGSVIYYLMGGFGSRSAITDNVATTIGDTTAQVGNAAKATLTNSKDVLVSAASTGAKSVADSAQAAKQTVAEAAAVAKSAVSGDVARVSAKADSVVNLLTFGRNPANAQPAAINRNTTAAANVSTGGESFIQPRTQARTRQQQGPSANQIFNSMMTAYANAETYSDNGQIHLDYRQQGLAKREVMKFSTAWDAKRGACRAELFESKVICDGALLTCYIYDVDTKNFGRQQLVIPVSGNRQPPIGKLISDDIARSFVTGSQDFPVRNSQRPIGDVLLPPALALLSGDVKSSWLNPSSTKIRFEDSDVDGVDCYCIGSGVRSESKLYIDKATALIRRVDYPQQLLVENLLMRSDVKEIALYATFADAQMNRSLVGKDFTVKAQPNARTVSKFVELPQALPSDYLGKTIRNIELIDRNGDPFNVDNLRGQITTVAWIGNELWIPLVDQLSQIKRSGYQEFQFGVAYPAALLSPASNEVPRPVDDLRAKERLGVPLLLDTGAAAETLQLNELPVLLVFDQNGKVQFVRSMKDRQWGDELKTVLGRLANNEDIAQEMLDGYLTHLDDYDAALQRVSADQLLAGHSVAVAEPVARRTPIRDTKIKLTPNKKWSQDSFERPGNILVVPERILGDVRFAIFDGFQTLNLIDDRGEVLQREKLDIPQEQGVSLIRLGGGGRGVFAVFEKRGSQVHFFDRNLQKITSFPKATERHNGILDCSPIGEDGKFLLSFNDDHGVYEFDPLTGRAEVFSKMVATKTAVFGSKVVGLVNGEVVDLDRGDVLVGNDSGDLTALNSVEGRGDQLVATVRSAADQWDAVSYSSDLSSRWSVPLNSQLFTNEVESISSVTTKSGETYWSFVDSGNSVCLISDRGTWLGDFEAESAIHGVALATRGDKVDLVVSTSDKVVCWALNYSAR